jgi:hypothetical protein
MQSILRSKNFRILLTNSVSHKPFCKSPIPKCFATKIYKVSRNLEQCYIHKSMIRCRLCQTRQQTAVNNPYSEHGKELLNRVKGSEEESSLSIQLVDARHRFDLPKALNILETARCAEQKLKSPLLRKSSMGFQCLRCWFETTK